VPQRSRLSTTLCGVAGEYFVAAELYRRGYVASLTLRNTRGIDILASNADATKSVGIQVKAMQGSGREWMLNQKIETEVATNLVFVFVRLNDLGAPEYFVVSKAEAAKYAKENHVRWLDTPGKKGQRAQVERAGAGNYQTLINDALAACIQQRSVIDAGSQVVSEELAAPKSKARA
jgi:hypothetical protein